MSDPTNSLSCAYTLQLAPVRDDAVNSAFDDSLLPLFQRWVLALLVSNNKLDQLTVCSEHRRVLKVGNPEFWSGIEDDFIAYADDEERGHVAEMRRKKCWIGEMLSMARMNVSAVKIDYSHPVFFNVRALGELLSLTDADMVVLCFLVLMHGDDRLRSSIERMGISLSSESDCVVQLSAMTGCNSKELQRVFRRNGALRSMGLLTLGKEPRNFDHYLALPSGLSMLMLDQHESIDPLVQHFFKPRNASPLGTSNFPHLADEMSIVAGILGEAMRLGVPGTNVLLYGPPGVGKTEIASVVAQTLNAQLYEVGYADDEGAPIRGVERLQAFNLCQRLLSRRTDALVLFDEVEDMLERGEIPGKAWVNRALEENPVPAIWITNHEDALDLAYRRRFDYSVKITTPPRAVRLQIASHHLQGIASVDAADFDQVQPSTDQSWLMGLAECPTLTPAQMERAAKVARLVEAQALKTGDTAPAQRRVLQVLERSARLFGQPKMRPGRPMATSYDLAYLHTDAPIADLVESLRLKTSGSFCFYGPPGAGKTALARYLAQELELPVVLRRASDLLDMYVGGTEQKIAEMFTAARSEPCVLILDEADSFFQSRADAKHSWEITQVNELLTQMEEHEGLFICTTNLLEKLDPASLRRFDWKVAFKPMTASQRWALFLQEFHLLGGDIETAMPLQPMVRQQLGGLTPGDFAPVTRQFRLLRRTPSAQEFCERLRSELATKNGGSTESPAYLRTYGNNTAKKNLPVAA